MRADKGARVKFTRKMEEAVAALLTQRNHEEAARAVGISQATLLRWQKEPEFQAAYREARRAVYSQSVARLQQATSAAATTLEKTMIDAATPASVRVRAAEAIFAHAAKAIEIEDIEARDSRLSICRRGVIRESTSQTPGAAARPWPTDRLVKTASAEAQRHQILGDVVSQRIGVSNPACRAKHPDIEACALPVYLLLVPAHCGAGSVVVTAGPLAPGGPAFARPFQKRCGPL